MDKEEGKIPLWVFIYTKPEPDDKFVLLDDDKEEEVSFPELTPKKQKQWYCQII